MTATRNKRKWFHYGVNKVKLFSAILPKAIRSHQYFQHFLSYTREVTDFFSNVEIETTSICNRKCPYCPNSIYDTERAFMSIGLFRRIMNELARVGFEGHVKLHRYGEPLMDDRLPTLVSIVQKQLPSAVITIFTNGDLLTVENHKKLVQSGVDYFKVTQHCTVTNGEIISQMPESISRLIQQLDKNDMQRITFDIISPDMQLSNRGGLISLIDVKPPETCVKVTKELQIDYKGNVLLCCDQYRAEDGPVFGNLGKNSLLEIWENPYYKAIRKNLRKGIFQLDICKRCGWGKWEPSEQTVARASSP